MVRARFSLFLCESKDLIFTLKFFLFFQNEWGGKNVFKYEIQILKARKFEEKKPLSTVYELLKDVLYSFVDHIFEPYLYGL